MTASQARILQLIPHIPNLSKLYRGTVARTDFSCTMSSLYNPHGNPPIYLNIAFKPTPTLFLPPNPSRPLLCFPISLPPKTFLHLQKQLPFLHPGLPTLRGFLWRFPTHSGLLPMRYTYWFRSEDVGSCVSTSKVR